MKIKIKKIALLTSGGDSPGMNACIRAIVRTAIYHNLEVVAVYHGYDGLILNNMEAFNNKSVSNIIQRGGTILKSARSKIFYEYEGRKKAFENLKNKNIDALITIGGDGTFRGATTFGSEFNFPIIGIPGTIDNDMAGTDYTIGYDTAINTVIEAVDKIRDTAESHDRLFIVEVMGRDAGLIALRSGIGVGAEAILIPESENDLAALIKRLGRGRKDKSSKIIMVAEGDENGGAIKVAEEIKKHYNNFDIRVSILGHMQRGGAPTCADRVLASQLGFYAVESLLQGKRDCMVGIVNRKLHYTPFSQAIKHNHDVYPDLIRMVEILS